MDVFKIAQIDDAHVGAAVAWVAEAIGAMGIEGMYFAEEPAEARVRSEQLDDGFRIEVESCASCVAGGNAIGEQFGALSLGFLVLVPPKHRNLFGAALARKLIHRKLSRSLFVGQTFHQFDTRFSSQIAM